MGVCCLEGMAGSMRVRNLLEPLLEKNLITVNNLIYKKHCSNNFPPKGEVNNINYKIIGSKQKGFLNLRFFYDGFRFIKNCRKRNQKNIIYNYDSPDIKNILFILFARLLGYKIIIDVVEDYRFFLKFTSILQKIRVHSSFFLLKRMPMYVDAVITISSHLEQRMNAICKGKIPIFLIPITVNFKYFKNNNPNIISGNDIKIFYGGSFGQKDGLEYLIQAFDKVAEQNSSVKLILTGRKHDDYDFANIMKYVNNANNKDRIDYRGFISTEEYYILLNECDIFCMTRNNTVFANAGFPFKLGEFLATGKSVISTNVGDVSKYLINGFNSVLIEPESIDEIVKALTYVIRNPEVMEKMGKQARQTAYENFNSDLLSHKVYEIFNIL